MFFLWVVYHPGVNTTDNLLTSMIIKGNDSVLSVFQRWSFCFLLIPLHPFNESIEPFPRKGKEVKGLSKLRSEKINVILFVQTLLPKSLPPRNTVQIRKF